MIFTYILLIGLFPILICILYLLIITNISILSFKAKSKEISNKPDSKEDIDEVVNILREVVNYWYGLRNDGKIRRSLDEESYHIFNKANKMLDKYGKIEPMKDYNEKTNNE